MMMARSGESRRTAAYGDEAHASALRRRNTPASTEGGQRIRGAHGETEEGCSGRWPKCSSSQPYFNARYADATARSVGVAG